jgi:hypothetical protein
MVICAHDVAPEHILVHVNQMFDFQVVFSMNPDNGLSVLRVC